MIPLILMGVLTFYIWFIYRILSSSTPVEKAHRELGYYTGQKKFEKDLSPLKQTVEQFKPGQIQATEVSAKLGGLTLYLLYIINVVIFIWESPQKVRILYTDKRMRLSTPVKEEKRGDYYLRNFQLRQLQSAAEFSYTRFWVLEVKPNITPSSTSSIYINFVHATYSLHLQL